MRFLTLSATIMGVTRDESDARELLYGNFYYRGDVSKIPQGITVRNTDRDITDNNNHFSDLEKPGVDAGSVLIRVPGQILGSGGNQDYAAVPNPDPAGVLTSRAFMSAHATAGTNRRTVEFTFREFMCTPIEGWADTKVPDVRIGKDIDRFPGGDHQKFLTTCKGCHDVMDGFRGAFAKWDAGNGRIYNSATGVAGGAFDPVNGQRIARKMNQNATVFPDGYQTVDDSWINNARGPANASLFGWRSTNTSGKGVSSMGQLISNSKRFSQCMATRVFEGVCRRHLDMASSQVLIDSLSQKFESSNYNLKRLFQEASIAKQCSE